VSDHWTESFFEGTWDKIIRNVYPPERSRAEAAFMFEALGLGRGARVLDVPCGDGRISLELARMGCDVVGVDRTKASVRRARRRARASGLGAEFRVGDMRRPEVEGPFAAVVNWWGSFGYFSDAENLAMLKNLAALLLPGGCMLIDQVNREGVLRDFRHSAWDEYGTVRVHVRNRWNPRTQRIEGTWTMIDGDARTRRRTSMRIYTPRQMERLLGRAGLELARLYGWIDGTRYTRGSRRMIAVAEKR